MRKTAKLKILGVVLAILVMYMPMINSPQAMPQKTDVLIASIGNDYALDIATMTLMKELTAKAPQPLIAPIELTGGQTLTPRPLSIAVLSSSLENGLKIARINVAPNHFSSALRQYNPKVLIIVGHGTPQGITSPTQNGLLTWQEIGESLQDSNIASVNVAACYSSTLKQYASVDIVFEGLVDVRLASLFIATTILYSIYGLHAPQTQATLSRLLETSDKLLAGKLVPIFLAPIVVTITTWTEWVLFVPVPHLKISVKYNTIHLFASIVLGAVMMALSIATGSMKPWGFVYEIIGFILKLVDFGWWWGSIVVPILQIALTAVLFNYLAPVGTSITGAITAAGYSVSTIAAAFVTAYAGAKFFVSVFKYLGETLLQAIGLYNSATKALIDYFGYKAEGKIRNFLYNHWADTNFQSLMGSVFGGMPPIFKTLLYDVAIPILDYLIWSYGYASSYSYYWGMQVF